MSARFSRVARIFTGSVRPNTARAGTIPIRDSETGDVHANMFFVAYTLDRLQAAPVRPLTFLWNGGPGSNAGLVHLLGFGPRRITTATGAMPRYSPSGTALVDNQQTWLTFSDLVFVDPIGTGYSRPTKTEYGAEFYQSAGDAESVAEFIRVFRLRFAGPPKPQAKAEDPASLSPDAPLYLMGESYGVTRASLVANALARRRMKVDGVILLSGGFPLEDQMPAPVRNALSLPIWTAAAHHHKKLAPDLQQGSLDAALRASLAYAEGEYAAALARIDALSTAERDTVVAQVARFSGLPASQINVKTLRVTTEQMSTSLLGRTLMVGRYDSRAVGPPDTSGGPYDPTRDPSLKDILEATSVLRYLREELGYRSDLQYQGPFGGGYPPATAFRGDWMSVRWNRNGVGDGASRSRIILRYLREDLGFRTDLSYRGLETGWSPPPGRAGGPNSRWVWNQGEATVASGTDAARTANRASVGSGDGPPGGSQPWMRRAMALDPQLRLFVAAGRYDSLNSCADNSWTVGHLDPGIAKNISLGCYAGGHMRFVGSSGRRGQTGVRPPRRQENTILMISGLTPV